MQVGQKSQASANLQACAATEAIAQAQDWPLQLLNAVQTMQAMQWQSSTPIRARRVSRFRMQPAPQQLHLRPATLAWQAEQQQQLRDMFPV